MQQKATTLDRYRSQRHLYTWLENLNWLLHVTIHACLFSFSEVLPILHSLQILT